MTRSILVLSMLLGVLAGWLWNDYREFCSSIVANRDTIIYEIPRGEGLRGISGSLSAKNVISRPYWFQALAYEKGLASQLKYGEYEIRPGISIVQLLDQLASGKSRQFSVTLVEGWRFSQVLDYLESHPSLVHTLVERSQADVMAALNAPGESPEGRFFPDTYFFGKGAKDVDILKRAYRKMQLVLDFEWQKRSGRTALATPYQALTLASIVEKETARSEERPLIAGVFMRRLERGMLLQTDPTVIYGLGSTFSGNLTRDHLVYDTLYNTYLHPGLPPTPIAIPSGSSIRAALHPADGDALYFVSKGDGYHQFSSSLTSHNEAVNQYQKTH